MTDRIEVNDDGAHAYVVAVIQGGRTTTHRVTVPVSLLQQVGVGPGDEERLVQVSFEFLLEREPASSILTEFQLDVIGRYFPEYVATVRARFA